MLESVKVSKPSAHGGRSVEKGTSILPPFETPVGKVGLTICFDVCHLVVLRVLKSSCRLPSFRRIDG